MSTPTWPLNPERVIATARRDIGLGEYPPGSNSNRITRNYGIGNGAWCAMAVWDWFNQNGVDLRDKLGARESRGKAGWAYTPAGVAAAKRAGLWHNGHSGIKRGDIVFYKLPGAEGSDFVNHVGIITSATAPAHVMSIEGNTSNVVAERTRARGYIVGYLRPPYGPAVPAPSPPPFPGAAAFSLNRRHDAVTALGVQLVRTGYARYHDGNGYQPGPKFTAFDRKNVAAFQRAQGWTGVDADGYPGPETWRRLFLAPTKTTTRATG